MTLEIGFTPDEQFFLSAEARIQMPHGPERLCWTALFESEALFLHLAVLSSLTEQELTLLLKEVIQAIAETTSRRRFEVDLEPEQLYALGLGTGVCMAYGPEIARM